MPCNDAGNNCGCSWNGGRDVTTLEVSEEVSTHWMIGQSIA